MYLIKSATTDYEYTTTGYTSSTQLMTQIEHVWSPHEKTNILVIDSDTNTELLLYTSAHLSFSYSSRSAPPPSLIHFRSGHRAI